MKINKEYRRGGFFGNSQNKFKDMAGADGGINMAFKGIGPFAGKGSALRREKRWLKKLERQGRLNEAGSQSQDRLDYLRNVQKDRAKKAVGAGALAAGAAFGAPALIAGIKGAGAGAAAGKAGAAASKGFGKKAGQFLFKNRKALGSLFGGVGGGNTQAASQYSPEEQEQAMEGNFGQPGYYGEDGMRIYPNRVDAEDLAILRAMLGARLPR